MPASILPWLKDNLNPTLWTLLNPVQGLQSPASKLSDLIVDPPMADGKEGSTELTMQLMFRTLMRILGTLSAWRVRPDVLFNLTERGSGSSSSAAGPRLLPDMIVTCASCTMLIGEGKEADKLLEAEADIKVYGKLGIPAALYGIVPGIPAYAASGSKLQFMFIPRGGTSAQVCVVGAGSAGQAHVCRTSACFLLGGAEWRRRGLIGTTELPGAARAEVCQRLWHAYLLLLLLPSCSQYTALAPFLVLYRFRCALRGQSMTWTQLRGA